MMEKNMSASTPERTFFHSANSLPFVESVMLGMELCGRYVTGLTDPRCEEGTYLYVRKSDTTRKKIKGYVKSLRLTKDGKKGALKALKYVSDGSASPMSTYLYAIMCIPSKYGCAGLPKADVSTAYEEGGRFLPGARGSYLAYDLCWPYSKVAVQYVGNGNVSDEDMLELEDNDMTVITVRQQDLYSIEAINLVVDSVAECLGIESPTHVSYDTLRKTPIPLYSCMQLTKSDIMSHVEQGG